MILLLLSFTMVLLRKVVSGKFENCVQYGKKQGMERRKQGEGGMSREREEEGGKKGEGTVKREGEGEQRHEGGGRDGERDNT